MPPGDYKLDDGTIIPSVTEVCAQMRSSYRGHSIEEAARLGTVIHSCIERSFASVIADDDIPEEASAAWRAWCDWRFEREPLLHRLPGGLPASEVKVIAAVPRDLAFGGRVDLVVDLQGRLYLVDIKTRTVGDDGKLPTADRWSMTQLGGYAIAWRQSGYDRLSGALILLLGRNAPVYRECWIDLESLWLCESEFLNLRTALYAHEQRKARLKERA
jgi:hypothetical protein